MCFPWFPPALCFSQPRCVCLSVVYRTITGLRWWRWPSRWPCASCDRGIASWAATCPATWAWPPSPRPSSSSSTPRPSSSACWEVGVRSKVVGVTPGHLRSTYKPCMWGKYTEHKGWLVVPLPWCTEYVLKTSHVINILSAKRAVTIETVVHYNERINMNTIWRRRGLLSELPIEKTNRKLLTNRRPESSSVLA